MFNEQRNNQLTLATLVVALLTILGGCGPTPAPTPLPTSTATPMLTSTPIPPTFTPVPPTVRFDIQPNIPEIQVGQEIAIVANVEPPQKVNLTWSITGTSGGRVFPETGGAVIYTAGGKPGTDIVTAEGSTASGALVKHSTSFKVIPPPPAGCKNFTSPKVIRPPLAPASSGATASFSAPQHCEAGLPAGEALPVGGTATNVASGNFLWLLVYASGKYYPQCNDVYQGECGANLSKGIWGVTAYIGRKGCKEHIHLVLVTMNQSDNNGLIQEMLKRVPSGDFGFARSKLPASVEEVASIEIETAGGICP